MAKVIINGHKIHEIRMPLTPYENGLVSSISYPDHRIEALFIEGMLVLRMPAFLALELYRRAILPQYGEESVSISLGRKNLGHFRIIDFHYPNFHAKDSEQVSITFKISVEEKSNRKQAWNTLNA